MKKKDKILSIAIIVALFFAIGASICHNKPKCNSESHKKVFTEIFETDAWGGVSGIGAKKGNAIPYIKFLQYFIDNTDINSIVDIGCGDWQIMECIKIPDTINYLGLDIVDKIVLNNKKKFEKNNIKFVVNNSVKELSKFKGDLLILKDVIQHWTNKDIFFAINKILPNFKYAIIVNNIWSHGAPPINSEIISGSSRPLDLEVAPFFMKLRVIMDYRLYNRHKRVYLYVRGDQNTSKSLWDEAQLQDIVKKQFSK